MGGARSTGQRRGKAFRLVGLPVVLGLLAWAGAVVVAPAPVVTATIPVGIDPYGVVVNPVTCGRWTR
jgi:hypothetical protein